MKSLRRWALAWLSALSLMVPLLLGAGPAFAQGDQGGTGVPFGSSTATVTRVYGETRQATAMAIAQLEFANNNGQVPSGEAILAAGNNRNLVDALLADPLAKALDVPILLTQNADTLGTTLTTDFTYLGVSKVILVGAVNNSTIISQLPSGVSVVGQYGDSNPYDTAAAVAGALASATGSSGFSNIFIASGAPGHWVDALSASPAAAMLEAPILLVPQGANTQLPSAELQYVYGSPTVYQLGSVAYSDVTNLPTSTTVKPLTGPDRFGTALAVDEQFFPHPSVVYLANGDDAHLVDALTVAPLAASQQAPIIIVNGAVYRHWWKQYLQQIQPSVTTYVIVGGGASIPSQVTQEVEQEQHARHGPEFFWRIHGWFFAQGTMIPAPGPGSATPPSPSPGPSSAPPPPPPPPGGPPNGGPPGLQNIPPWLLNYLQQFLGQSGGMAGPPHRHRDHGEQDD